MFDVHCFLEYLIKDKYKETTREEKTTYFLRSEYYHINQTICLKL